MRAKGFLDTGNRLYDRETDAPVVICSKSVAFELSDNLRVKLGGKPLKIATAAEAVDRVSAEKELTTELAFRIDVFVKGQ